MKKLIQTIIPPDSDGWESIFFSVLTAIGIYLARSQWNKMPPLGMGGFILIFLMPLCCFPLSFIAYHMLIAFQYGKKHWTPLSFLLGSIVIAMIYSTPPTFEEEIFFQHRADYEYLVELAHDNQLFHNEECKATFAPPLGYEQLSADSCIWIEFSPTFTVEFMPRSFYRPLVFFDDPTKIEASDGACHSDGSIRKQVDAHWFICNRDPN